MEFLSVYGTALLIVAIVVSVIIAAIGIPSSLLPNSCITNGNFHCSDVVVGKTASSPEATAYIAMVNSLPYPIKDPKIMFSTTTGNSSEVSCSPTFVAPGGAIICSGNFASTQKAGALVTGQVLIKFSECQPESTNESNCQVANNLSVTGSFNAHVQPMITNHITVGLTAATNPVNLDTPDALYATVNAFGAPLPGATVLFNVSALTPLPPGASIHQSASLNPLVTTTNQSGVALGSLTIYQPRDMVVTATFANIPANIIIYFIPPTTTTTSTTTSTSTTTILTTTSVSTSTSTTTTILPTVLAYIYGTGGNDAISSNVYYAPIYSDGSLGAGGPGDSYLTPIELEGCGLYNNVPVLHRGEFGQRPYPEQLPCLSHQQRGQRLDLHLQLSKHGGFAGAAQPTTTTCSARAAPPPARHPTR